MIEWIGSFFDDHDDEMDKLKEVAIARRNNYITVTQSTSTALMLILKCARCS